MRPIGSLPTVFGIAVFAAVLGCSSVTFAPEEDQAPLPAKPPGFEVRILEWDEAGDYTIIGTVSCQDSATSSIWNWWTDQHALIMEMREDNLERLLDEVRDVGGDVLIGLQHDMTVGGSSGGLGVGVGTGVGGSPVGVGVGTSLLSGNPKIVITSYGSVGVAESRAAE